jgi:hypothetical protein
MKTLFKLLILLLFKKANAQSNLWLGTSSLNWNDSLNWSLKSVPNETDTIILNNCDSVILENDIITADLLVNNSSINLNNHRITLIDSLSIEESNLYNGLIKSDSTIACYFKRNSFHSTIDLNLRSIYNFQNTFNSSCQFNYRSNKYESIKGGNSFYSTVKWIHYGDSLFRLEQYEGSLYDSTVTFRNHGTGEIQISYSDSSKFNDLVIFENPGGGIFRFGTNDGFSLFTEHSELLLNSFEDGKLSLKNTYVYPSIDWSLNNNAKIEVNENTEFLNTVSIISPNIKLDGGHFWKAISIKKTGSESNLSLGSNIFESTVSIMNIGDGDMTLAYKHGDQFKGLVVFTRQGTGKLKVANSGDNYFHDDITINSDSFIRFGQDEGVIHLIGDSINLSNNQKTYVSTLDLSELKYLDSNNELIIEKEINIEDCSIDLHENNLHLRGNSIDWSNGGFLNWRRLIILGDFQEISLPYKHANTFKELSLSSSNGFNTPLEFFMNTFTENSFPRLYEVDMNPFDQFTKDSLIHPIIWSVYHDEYAPIELNFSLENGSSKHLNSPHFDTYNFNLNHWIPSTNEQSFDPISLGFKVQIPSGKNHFIINNDISILPLDLLSFKAKQENNGIHLSWVSASLIQSSHFALEKKENDNWFEIYREYTAENSNQTIEFTYTDYDLLENNIYRLRHFDKDNQCSGEWHESIHYIQDTELQSITNIRGQSVDRIKTSGIYFFKSKYGETRKEWIIID